MGESIFPITPVFRYFEANSWIKKYQWKLVVSTSTSSAQAPGAEKKTEKSG